MDPHRELGVESAVLSYLEAIMQALADRATFTDETAALDPVDSVFEVLTSRRYSHLGRTKSEAYRENVSDLVRHAVTRNEPIPFFYDLGSGYHASVTPGHGGLSFDVGLGELLAIHSVVSFCNEVRRRYEPGAHFHLVIDDLCGWATNDIPLERLGLFVVLLRELVRHVGAEDLVTVLVESENASQSEYLETLATIASEPPVVSPATAEIENVARFLGRSCTPGEAGERIEQYRRASIATEALLARAINGVRLTQRATPTTLGFRSFSGGDQRIQAGRVVFRARRGGGVTPFLMTSRNHGQFLLEEIDVSEVVPSPITRVDYADSAPTGYS